MKTYSPKPREVRQDWYEVDATGKTLGRLATVIADHLSGKRKPQYAPHVDVGDYVVVTNCDKIRVTGNKLQQKLYYRHSGYTGGLKQRTLQEQLDRHPEEVIRSAVKGMLPRNRMGAAQLRKLKVYESVDRMSAAKRRQLNIPEGADHPHANFNPKPLPGFDQ